MRSSRSRLAMLTALALVLTLSGARLASVNAVEPRVDARPQGVVIDVEIDEAELHAHVIRPPHIVGVTTGKGRVDELDRPQANLPAVKGRPYLDVDGFGRSLHAALKDSVAGYAMELRQHGKTIYTLEWQWAQTPDDAAEGWTPARQMHVASVSKLITAMAMTKLLDDHHLSYDATISSYLPAYWKQGPGVGKITFRNLLTETSGIDATSDETDYAFMKARVAAGASTVGKYQYLNMNFGLCRILLPIINGNVARNETFPAHPGRRDETWDYVTIRAYRKYVQDHVFRPAGVTNATLGHPADAALAYNFPARGRGWNSGDLSTVSGGAGWHLSIDQLLNVMGAFRRQGSIVAAGRAQAALDGYFGIDVVQATPLGRLYNKNGLWSDGSRIEQSLAYYLPQDMELAVFANSPIGKQGRFFRKVVTDIYLQSIKHMPLAAAER